MSRTLKSRFSILLLVAALLILAALPVTALSAPAEGRGLFWLTILHNNDGESQLLSASGNPDFGGVARFKTLVDHTRAAALTGAPPAGAHRGVLTVTAGDNFLAGPEWTASLEKGVPFYDSIALDLVGYDTMIIGNHDFDFGPDILADFISGFGTHHPAPPFLSANLDFSAEPRLQELVDSGDIAASTVIRERGRLIGVVGATTPQLPFISSPRNVIVDPDVVGAVQAEVDALTAAGVNIIIFVSHLQGLDQDLEIVPQLSGVDVAIAGGGDELLADPAVDLLIPGDEAEVAGSYPIWVTGADGASIPVITAPGGYAYLGRLVAGFDVRGRLLRINEAHSGPLRVSGVEPDAVVPDPAVEELVTEPVAAFLAELAATLVAESEVDLDGRRGSFAADPNVGVRLVETNEGNLIADALRWQATELAGQFGVAVPEIALQNGGGIRNDSIIPAGNITALDTFDMVPFPNFVSVVEGVTHAQLKELLENAVSAVEATGGRFAQVAGLSFEYTLAGTPQVLDAEGNVVTPGTRVLGATLDDGTVVVAGGAVVDPGATLSVATIDFLARGGDQYPFRGLPFTTLGVTQQIALVNYLESGLGGVITAADYPVGGEGRITRVP